MARIAALPDPMAVCGLGRGATVGAEPAAVVDTSASPHPDERAPSAGTVGAVHADRAGRIGGRRSDCYGGRALALHLAAAAVLGFASVAAIWWLYFDRQGDVALRGSTMSIVVYSYAHLPLLIGLAAMSAGLRLLIQRAGEDHLGTGASVAFLGGAVVFIVSLIATRLVTVRGSHRRGVSVKLGAAAVILGLLAIQSVVPPLAVAAGLAAVLASLVFVERMLGPGHETLCRCISAEEVT